MSDGPRDTVLRVRQMLTNAAGAPDEAKDEAIGEALVAIHNEVVAAHIGLVRSHCGADAELAVRISNALCDVSAARLQRWALLAGVRHDAL